MLELRESILSDTSFLGPRLREADKEELRAAWGETPYAAILEYGFKNSDNCWTITHKDEPVAIFGNNGNTLWMVASKEFPKHRRDFLRKGHSVVCQLQEKLGSLYASSYYKNYLHHKWLLWLGFNYITYDGEYFIFHKDAVNV